MKNQEKYTNTNEVIENFDKLSKEELQEAYLVLVKAIKDVAEGIIIGINTSVKYT